MKSDPTIVTFDCAQLPSTPWKNGGGLTREVVRRPVEAAIDAFDWRVSIAEVSADGPFSTFPGIDRVLTLLSGGGMRLRFSDGRTDHLLDEVLLPFVLSGDDVVVASLIGAASSDVNVMTRRGVARAEVSVLRGHASLVEASAGVLLAVRGGWTASTVGAVLREERGSLTHSLTANSGLWWDGESVAWDVVSQDADSALIAVHVFGQQEHAN